MEEVYSNPLSLTLLLFSFCICPAKFPTQLPWWEITCDSDAKLQLPAYQYCAIVTALTFPNDEDAS